MMLEVPLLVKELLKVQMPLMGGASADDNSGKLNFVRVEYAGYEIFPGNELNGITFGAV